MDDVYKLASNNFIQLLEPNSKKGNIGVTKFSAQYKINRHKEINNKQKTIGLTRTSSENMR